MLVVYELSQLLALESRILAWPGKSLERWRKECDEQAEHDLCVLLDDALTACRAGVTA